MDPEVERASRDRADEDGREDIGPATTPPADTLAPPKPKFDRIGDLADRDRVFEAMFEVPAERQKLGRYVVLGTVGRGGMGVVLEAFDRTLDRRIALKVLHHTLDDRHTTRLLREAQALAKLSHPNVVQVYESGVADGQTFIAMELVRGKSLRTWLETDPRPGWRDCVEVFAQAGEGLTAAHAQGLVHRDFKPGNAILDEDGRVRVLDFGLAREAEEAGEAAETTTTQTDLVPDAAALDTPLTQTGTMLGTPSYMPPEQIDGREADARSDQFSFCVSVYEAVYGERPFAGSSMAALMNAIVQGKVKPAPKGTKVPAALRQVLLRGLAPDPEDRWASMNDLLVQLRAQVAPRKWRGVVMAGGLVVGLGSVGAGLAYQANMGQRCVGASAQLEGIWDDARRGEVRTSILETALPYAPNTWERVEQRLDDYADAWTDTHTESCMATSVRQEQTAEEMGLRMGCLRKRRTELSAAVGVLAQADAEVVKNAVALTAGLPLLDRCDDLTWLAAQQQRLPPPEDPQVAEQVDALRERLAEIKATQNSGKYALALEQVSPVLEQAKALDYMPLVAEVMLSRGRLQERNGHYPEAEEDLRRAYALAAEHDHESVELEAARSLISVVGTLLERHAEGLQWGDAAQPLAVRYGDATDRAKNAMALGDVALQQGKYPEAQAQHQRALQLNEQALGADHPELATNLSGVAKAHYRQGNLEESEALFGRALRINETALGPNHPLVAASMSDLGSVLGSQGKLEESEALLRKALRLREEVLGPDHPRVAASAHNLGLLLDSQGRHADAEVLHRQALRINEATMGHEHPLVANSMFSLGRALVGLDRADESEVLLKEALQIQERTTSPDNPRVASIARALGILLEEQGKFADAEPHYRRALQIWEKTWSDGHPNVATVMNDLSGVLVHQGKLEEADAYYRRALQIWERASSFDDVDLATTLVGLATVCLSRGVDIEAAREHAERAASIREAAEVHPADLATARFVLARALWSDQAQRARARALVERAREAFADDGEDSHADLADVEQWLAEHPVK